MRVVRRVVMTLVTLLVAAPGVAAAKLPDGLTIPDNLDCRQTFFYAAPTPGSGWAVADRGHLVFHVDSNSEGPTSYDFDAFWLTTQARAGGWSWTGHVNFDSGPLALQGEGWPTVVGYWYAHGRGMPHDNVRGRTANLVLESLDKGPYGTGTAQYAPAQRGHQGQDAKQTSYWYCAKHGVVPRRAFAGVIRRVRRASGLKVRLPTWFEPSSQGRETGERGFVRAVKKGTYTLELVSRRCRKGCAPLGIFSAKRAPAGELGHRQPIRLARGVRGWVGDVGCGAGGGPDWGPVFCGMEVIVWHYRGINYAIQGQDQSDSQLMAYANQALKYG
jgi:hypothetical protein